MRTAFLLFTTAPTVIILPRAVSLNTTNGDIIFTLVFCGVCTTDLRKKHTVSTTGINNPLHTNVFHPELNNERRILGRGIFKGAKIAEKSLILIKEQTWEPSVITFTRSFWSRLWMGSTTISSHTGFKFLYMTLLLYSVFPFSLNFT